MKKILLILSICLPSLLMAQDSARNRLYEGTIVTIQLMQDLSSKNANEGDILEFETTEPIIVGDKVLVHKGAKVTGKVTESARRKGMGKAGKLNFTIDYLTLPGGKIIKLTSEQKVDGKNTTGAAVAQAVLLTPLFLLKKGKDVKFEKGHIFKAFIEKDVEI
jgi:ribosomal protein L21